MALRILRCVCFVHSMCAACLCERGFMQLNACGSVHSGGGGAGVESRAPQERPCWASKPGARLKARPVWRSPWLGSSWIKDGREVSVWKAISAGRPHTSTLKTNRCSMRQERQKRRLTEKKLIYICWTSLEEDLTELLPLLDCVVGSFSLKVEHDSTLLALRWLYKSRNITT